MEPHTATRVRRCSDRVLARKRHVEAVNMELAAVLAMSGTGVRMVVRVQGCLTVTVVETPAKAAESANR